MFVFSFNLVKENVIFTPAIDGAILPGITRKTIIDIAIDLGYKVFILSSQVLLLFSTNLQYR
jgi:branched-chain amino acid aminotransferase